DHLDMIDGADLFYQIAKTPRGQDQRITSRQNNLPDRRVRADIINRAVYITRIHSVLARTNHFTAEAKATINCAGMYRFKQHTVGITVYNPADRFMHMIANGI